MDFANGPPAPETAETAETRHAHIYQILTC